MIQLIRHDGFFSLWVWKFLITYVRKQMFSVCFYPDYENWTVGFNYYRRRRV
jgi:hypothetical protein